MGYTPEVIQTVRALFEKKREETYRTAQERKNEIYLAVPGTRDIDEALSRTGLRIYAEALNKGADEPLETRLARLKEENAELQRARGALLRDAGYPADYTKPVFSCEKCRDTGYIGLAPCDCLLRALQKESYLSAGLGAMLADQSFDNFDLSYYTGDARRTMAFVRQEAEAFADGFGKEGSPKNALFYGGTGLGKTHLSTAIAKRVIDRGFSVVYESIIPVMQVFEAERFSKNEPQLSSERYFDCDLLILDDLGTEFANSFTHAALYNLINTRLISGKGTLISTNLSDIAALKKAYDERLVSRIVGGFRAYGFAGSDIRLLRNKKK